MNKYIKEAFKEAKKAHKIGEVPIGCVIVYNEKIISRAHNLIEKKHDQTFHAELIAISKASKKMKNWRLNDCDIYVTMYPCKMCVGAIGNSRINKTYYLINNKNNVDKTIKSSKINDKNLEEEYMNLLKVTFNRK